MFLICEVSIGMRGQVSQDGGRNEGKGMMKRGGIRRIFDIKDHLRE
jgi:hypothetical protein